ncbi:MAG TPA: F0F1 ATP synthase subunit delta [Candidatus Saccharimonadales bacterium]|nr:F0F1 ATP synthase subunit delta [Candidatus Saccharimonadales bacterium]
MKKPESKKPDFKLEESVSSLQDLKAVILEIREYARWQAHNEIKKQLKAKSGKKSEAPTLSPSAQNVLHSWVSRGPINPKSMDELVTTLENYAKSAPQFTIVLAAMPTASLKKTIVNWCRSNVAPNVMVNFQFNSSILGGMVVRSGSHVYDWSFRRQIMSAGPKFPEALRRV